MPIPSPHSIRSWIGWFLFAAALAILVYHFDAGSVPRNRLYHPEAIYPAALYLDFGNWSTWTTPFSPYFFPDIPLFFLCMWAAGSVPGAIYAFAALQYTLLILGFYFLFGAVFSGDRETKRLARRLVVLAGAAAAVAFAYNFHGRGMLLQLFVCAFHTGAFVLAVWAQLLLIVLLNRRPQAAGAREYGLLALLFFLCLLGVLSDRLFLVLFVLPAVLTLCVYGLRMSPAPRWLRAGATLAAGGWLGGQAVSWINAAEGVQVGTFTPSIEPSEVFGALRALPRLEENVGQFVRDRFFENLGTAYRAYWLLWLLLTLLLAFAARRWLARRAGFRGLSQLADVSRRNLAFVAALSIASFGLIALATVYVAVGYQQSRIGFHGLLFVNRYLISLYTIPLLAPALYLPALLGHRRARRLELPLLAVVAVLCLARGSSLDLFSPFPRFRPPDVACLDEKAAEHDLKYGLAYFSEARRINVFSRTGLHADQMSGEFEPIAWIASRRRPGEQAGYDFVLMSGLKRGQDVVERLGEPDRELECHGKKVWVYDPPRFPSSGEAK